MKSMRQVNNATSARLKAVRRQGEQLLEARGSQRARDIRSVASVRAVCFGRCLAWWVGKPAFLPSPAKTLEARSS